MDTPHPPKMAVLTLLIAAVVGGVIYLNSQKVPRTAISGNGEVKTVMTNEEKEKLYSVAKEITTPDGFINTGGTPITIEEFVGTKVVLIDFWTYSCINCQRTTPYLNAWYEKYKDKGLVIIGVHTPEFEFEKDYQNVLEATKRLGIKYPVVLDNDFSTWNAYQNRFWPRKYLIDIDGYVVYDHIGEGAYDETERKIQELLAERIAAPGERFEIAGDVARPHDADIVDFSQVKSPETYFGALRNKNFGSGTPYVQGTQEFSRPQKVEPNILYLSGRWNIQNEYAETAGSEHTITFRFHAKKVHLVLSAPRGAVLTIRQDGGPEKKIPIQEDALYTLIENDSYGEHTVEITIPGPAIRLFAFTFG